MLQELIPLYSRVTFPEVAVEANPSFNLGTFVLNMEAATLGYTLAPDVMERLGHLPFEVFNQARVDILSALREVSGASTDHVALFSKFPYGTPDQRAYLKDRLVGHVQNMFGLLPKDGKVLSCGHVIDTRLFNMADFGACPICQFQVDEIDGHEEIRHDFQNITPLKPLRYADNAFIATAAQALLGRGSSLSEQEKTFLMEVGKTTKLVAPETIFKENLPFVYSIGGADVVIPHLSGATDVLRIAYYVSDPKSDLSLKENVKFRIATRHKRAIMRMLISLAALDTPALMEDMMRHRERWLRLGEQLHPTAKVWRKALDVAYAFDMVRNHPKEIVTFNRQVEQKVRLLIVDEPLMTTLDHRPGEMLRRMDFLLRTANNIDMVFAHLKLIVAKAPTRRLMEVAKYLEHRRTPATHRMFVPKGRVNRMQLVPDDRRAISDNVLTEAAGIMMTEVQTRLARRPAMGNVYVDPSLRDILVPYNKRGDSATSAAIIKGSKYPLSAETKIVRLFLWWKGNFDIDLSMICYDKDFGHIGHIGFTNTHAEGCVHSGDIQNAPRGASEFIDFDLSVLRSRRIRYVVSSVISYRGEHFDTFPCYAGFMERDALQSGAKYEPASVALKFDVNAPNTSCMPLIFDLEENKLVFADIASASAQYGWVRGQSDKLANAARMVLDLTNRKLTAYDVLTISAKARGRLVYTPDDADLTFSINGAETSFDIEKVMDDYLE